MNLSSCWNEFKNCLSKRKIVVIATSILFLCSIMCGIILHKTTIMNEYYLNYCDNYIYRVFSSGGVWSIFLGRFFRNILFIIILTGASLVIFLFPIHIFLVFFNGFVLGTELVILCTEFSVCGFFVAVLLFLPQYILLGFILIASAPFSLDCGIQIFKDKSFFCVHNYIRWLVIFSAVSVLACLLEFFTIIFIFKPFAWVL